MNFNLALIQYKTFNSNISQTQITQASVRIHVRLASADLRRHWSPGSCRSESFKLYPEMFLKNLQLAG